MNHNLTYTSINNFDILNTFSINEKTYGFNDSLTDYKKIKISLKIGEKEKSFRYIILSLTLCGGLFLVGARYLSFYREYKIIKESGTPFYKSRFCLYLFIEGLFLLIFNIQH